MFVKFLVLCNCVVLASAGLKRRPLRSMQKGTTVWQKKLCGPHPQAGEDCEPSLCSILSGPGKNPELQFLTTCVPVKVPSFQLRNQNTDNVNIINSKYRLALRAKITSSTSAPFDTGGKPTTPNPTPAIMCNGLAICRNLFQPSRITTKRTTIKQPEYAEYEET